MKIELFHTAGCRRCAEAQLALQSAARQAVPALEWREIDPGQEIDYAVELGVMGLPALAIDGELAFATLPTPAQLVAELRRRAAPGTDGS